MNRPMQTTTPEHTGPRLSGPSPAAPQHKNVQRLLQGPITPTLARLAAPNMVGFLVGSGVMVAEMWFVGQLGTHALAGLALGYPLYMLVMMLSAGALGGAMAAAVARAVGAGLTRKAEDLGWHAIIIAVAVAGFFTGAYLLFGAAFYRLLGGTGNSLAAAIAYSDVVLVGGGAIWLNNTLSSILRGSGDMKTPALGMLGAAALQIPLGGALSLGWGPFPELGIAGVAWAALIAFGASSLYLALRLFSGRSGIRLPLAPPPLRWSLFREILAVGGIASLSPILTVTTVVLLTALVSRFGEAALAGLAIASRLEFLLIPIIFGIGAAMIAMVGANMGAGQLARAHRIGWTGGLAAAAIAGAIGTATALWPGAWAGIFTEAEPVRLAAALYLTVVGPFYAFHGLGLSLYFASQGAGAVAWPVVFTAVRLVVTAGGGYLAVETLEFGFEALPVVVAASMVVLGLGNAAAIYAGAWRRANPAA